MRKFSAAGILLSGLLLTATTASIAQSKEEIKQMFDKQVIDDKSVNTYNPVREVILENDVAWKKRVWRTVDISTAGNEFLALASVHPSIGDVLLNGVARGAFKAYSADDEHFTTELNAEAMQKIRAAISAGAKITSLKIKEDWLFVASQKKMVVRIVGIAPIFGAEAGRGDQPAFWVFYPYIREYLQTQAVAAPDMHPNNLDEVFEGRYFNSKIERVSEPMAAE